MQTTDGRLTVIGGATRSGKSAYARKLAARAPVALCFDIEAQWCALPGWRRFDDPGAFAHAVLTAPGRHALVPSGDLGAAFDYFARVAFRYADTRGGGLVIGEELADVTTPGKAPAAWGSLVRRGLKRGTSIIAISQRWAEADKTALGNASEIICFRQSSADDVRYMARKTRVPAELIDKLKPLEYVKYDCGAQVYEVGRLRF